jgi:hypothetical protein
MRRAAVVVVAATLLAAVPSASAKAPSRARIRAIVNRAVAVPSAVNGVVYGVWQHGRPIVTGARGFAQSGVPARTNLYARIGNEASKEWVVNNPQILGYSGIVAYNRKRDLSVVVFTTQGPQGNIAEAYATAIYEPLAKYLAPEDVPPLSALPRGQSGNK